MTHYVTEPWPNVLDATVTAVFLAGVLLLTSAGYVFMALDFRDYLRSLKRAVATMGRAFSFEHVPQWAARQTPRAVAALGLRMPCSEEDLKRAYRARVKRLHPDHGGDRRRFLILQANFEEALERVRCR